MFKYFVWADTEKPMSEFAIKAVEKEENFFLHEVKTEKELYQFFDNYATEEGKIYIAFGTGSFKMAEHLMRCHAPIVAYTLVSSDSAENHAIYKLLSLSGYRKFNIWREMLY